MKREYPSTPEEAFEASLEGAYYADQLAAAELQGRVGAFPAEPGVPVDSAWDIGIGDYTSIWLFQRLASRIRLVHIQDCGEGLPYYVNELSRLRAEHGWTFGEVYWPHDGKVREWGSGRSRLEQFQALTHEYPRMITRMGIDDGINAVRALLPHCEFDAAACSEGLRRCAHIARNGTRSSGVWRDKPRHDWSSHGADAFRCLASRYRQFEAPPPKPKPQEAADYASIQEVRLSLPPSHPGMGKNRTRRKRAGTFIRIKLHGSFEPPKLLAHRAAGCGCRVAFPRPERRSLPPVPPVGHFYHATLP